MDTMEGVIQQGGNNSSNKDADTSKKTVTVDTIRINNLEERTKLDDLKLHLGAVFNHYGTIIDIEAKGSQWRKGQAFVTYADHQSAVNALEMSGFRMYGKDIRVEMANTPSDASVRLHAPEQAEQRKRERQTKKERKTAEEANKAAKLPADKPRPVKTGAAVVPDEFVRPNKTLFLQNLPEDITADDLTAAFEYLPGFEEARYHAVRKVGFVDFEDEQFSITAKEAMANKPFGAEGRPIKITFKRQ